MSNLVNILRAAFFARTPEGKWGLPIMLWGPSAAGKTAIARAVAKACGLYFYRMAPSERGEGQFGVVPVPGSDGFLHYPPPVFAADLDKQASLLFVDEIDSQPLALQSPLLGTVQLRVIGEHEFSPHTRVMGAGNGVQGTHSLREDLMNRFGHVEFTGLDVESWVAGLTAGFVVPETEAPAEEIEKRVLEQWPAAIASARGVVGAFISRNVSLLHAPPRKGSNQRAYPTRRTVEYATYALASAKIQGLTESETDEFVGAFVGEAWVREFRQFTTFADLPDVAAVLDGRETFTHDPRSLDRTLVFLQSAAAHMGPAIAKDVRVRRLKGFWSIVEAIHDNAPEIVVPSIRAVQAVRENTAAGIKISQTTMARMFQTLVAAGLAADPTAN